MGYTERSKVTRRAGSEDSRGTEVQRDREGILGSGVAGGGFSLRPLPVLGTNRSPIKQVAFRPHELMPGALLGSCWGRELSAPHLRRKSPLQDWEPPGLRPSPAHCGLKRKGQRGLGLAFRRHSSSPGGSWTASASGPPARLNGQGRQMSLPTWEAAKGAGKERLARPTSPPASPPPAQSGQERQCFSLGLGKGSVFTS